MRRHPRQGFTLIEVVVALAIVGWVLGSTLSLVKQYADQRIQMRERFLAGQVAWNILMDEYRAEKGLLAPNETGRRFTEGEVLSAREMWQWQLETEPALGDELYRHSVTVNRPDSGQASATRALYLVHEVAEP